MHEKQQKKTQHEEGTNIIKVRVSRKCAMGDIEQVRVLVSY